MRIRIKIPTFLVYWFVSTDKKLIFDLLMIALLCFLVSSTFACSTPPKNPCKSKCESMGYFFESSKDEVCTCTNKLKKLGEFRL